MPKNYGILETVGLEIETEKIHMSRISDELDSSAWKVDNDVSIQSDCSLLSNGLIVSGSVPERIRVSDRITLGVEFVLNPPFSLEGGGEPLLDKIKSLCDTLMKFGESSQNKRAGIHVHIASPMNLGILKTYMVMGANMEDIFYLLATQGYTFRGQLANESAYCRPITQFGPPCMPISGSLHEGKYAQIFTIPELVKTKTLKEFWWRYGNVNMNGDTEHMHPVRYTWLNLYSLLAHGTMEFRVFNTTLNPYLIYSEILFCQAFCRYCVTAGLNSSEKLDMPENSVYDARERSDIMDTFLGFCDRVRLPSHTVMTLGDMLATAPLVSLPKRLIKSHILNTRNGRGKVCNFDNFPDVHYLESSEASSIFVDDIHLRRGEIAR